MLKPKRFFIILIKIYINIYTIKKKKKLEHKRGAQKIKQLRAINCKKSLVRHGISIQLYDSIYLHHKLSLLSYLIHSMSNPKFNTITNTKEARNWRMISNILTEKAIVEPYSCKVWEYLVQPPFLERASFKGNKRTISSFV